MPLWTETWSSAGGVSLCPGTGSLMAREGEEQSQRQQGTPWMLEKPRFCQSCVGEVSLGSFALRSFPLRGLGVGDVKAPPAGTSPLHHFLWTGNVPCKQHSRAGLDCSHAPAAPGVREAHRAPSPAHRPAGMGRLGEMALSPAMHGERDKDRGLGGWLGGSRKK